MSTATVNGTRIHYDILGEGTPVALSYCLGGNLELWRPQAQLLAQYYRVILWDPRGHGRSASPDALEDYGITTSASDLAGLLDHLDIDRAHVGGLSMGGGIAARFAQMYPQRALSVCILDSNTAAGLPVPEKTKQIRENTALLCEAGDMREAARYFIANSPPYELFAGNSEDNRKVVEDMVAAADPVGFANTLRAMSTPAAPTEELKHILAPTLIVAGDHDPALAAIRLTHEHIAGSVLKIIPGAGHLSNIDAPDAVLAVLQEFLQQVDTAST
ncbi:MAG: 3-oxoadipate enol-lactonase [Gammaproteobacteria bacterium]|jgi:3-oxoadipate enol-lactonase